MNGDRWLVPGSTRSRPPGEFLSLCDPHERATVSVILRSKHASPPLPGALTREEYAAAYGAGESDAERIDAFAFEYGLRVVERDLARRTMRLEGTIEELSAAFGVALAQYRVNGATFRGRTGAVSLPASLQNVVEAVLGLDTRPQAHPRVHVVANAATTFTPLQIAALYDFPKGANGSGQTIAIVELGGGYNASDLSAYCSNLGIAAPSVEIVSVDGATSNPGQDQGADTEVMLDVEMAGAIANGARIVLYFAPNTDQGFIDAVTTAVHDTTYAPSVVSISWGDAEANWTSAAMSALDGACAAAAAMGVTVCVASGDDGSSDGGSGVNVDFPASSPHALGCGGTSIVASNGTITTETAWSDSGGGISVVFALPSWQANAGVPAPSNPNGGRGVPDVCGDADPNTGYSVLVDGQSIAVGGTSAVAPLWAGLIALMNQQLGAPVGFLNPKLYTLTTSPSAAAPLHDITSGSNGAYSAKVGWDPVTGLGRPDGTLLESALK
jgi:kumamolisin